MWNFTEFVFETELFERSAISKHALAHACKISHKVVVYLLLEN